RNRGADPIAKTVIMDFTMIHFEACGEKSHPALFLFRRGWRRVQGIKIRASLLVNLDPYLGFVDRDSDDFDLPSEIREYRELGGQLFDKRKWLGCVAGKELQISERNRVTTKIEMSISDLGADAKIGERFSNLRLQKKVKPAAADINDNRDEEQQNDAE